MKPKPAHPTSQYCLAFLQDDTTPMQPSSHPAKGFRTQDVGVCCRSFSSSGVQGSKVRVEGVCRFGAWPLSGSV